MTKDSRGNYLPKKICKSHNIRSSWCTPQPHWATKILPICCQSFTFQPPILLFCFHSWSLLSFIIDFCALPHSCLKVIKAGLSVFVDAAFHNPFFAYFLSVITSKQISHRISVKSSSFTISSSHFFLRFFFTPSPPPISASLILKEQFPTMKAWLWCYSFSIFPCNHSVLLKSVPLFFLSAILSNFLHLSCLFSHSPS